MNGKFIDNGTITQQKISVGAPSNPSDVTRKDYVDAQITAANTTFNNALAALQTGLDWKKNVRVATTANITLTGTQTVDGITLLADDEVLVQNQTTGSQNGIYVVKAGAWVRRDDADTSAKLNNGAVVYVSEGAVNGKTSFVLTTTGAITLGTTSLTFAVFALVNQIVPVTLNRNMVALTTAADGDKACATSIQKTPALDSDVDVVIGGFFMGLGDGVKTKACYFSGDNGVTARLIKDIVAGDFLYWNGSVAGCQLAPTDSVDFLYSSM